MGLVSDKGLDVFRKIVFRVKGASNNILVFRVGNSVLIYTAFYFYFRDTVPLTARISCADDAN